VARKKRDEIRESDVSGLKYFDRLAPLLERLHEDGCARDKAGNRSLHFDQYCLLVLLYLFNPICSSLRAVQQASELPKVQKRLGCSRAALGSLSEAATVFDSERLIEIIQELGGQLSPIAKDARLKDVTLTKTLTLVDATLQKGKGRKERGLVSYLSFDSLDLLSIGSKNQPVRVSISAWREKKFPEPSLHGNDFGRASAGAAVDGDGVADGRAVSVRPCFGDSTGRGHARQ
jgi:hypothetical protein